jgi:hypothetical protein
VKPRPTACVPVIAVTREEAANALGVSLRHFQRHIAPELRTIRSGTVRLYPVPELERWAERSATMVTESPLPLNHVSGRAARQRPRP